jgi:hypothetical protein
MARRFRPSRTGTIFHCRSTGEPRQKTTFLPHGRCVSPSSVSASSARIIFTKGRVEPKASLRPSPQSSSSKTLRSAAVSARRGQIAVSARGRSDFRRGPNLDKFVRTSSTRLEQIGMHNDPEVSRICATETSRRRSEAGLASTGLSAHCFIHSIVAGALCCSAGSAAHLIHIRAEHTASCPSSLSSVIAKEYVPTLQG